MSLENGNSLDGALVYAFLVGLDECPVSSIFATYV